jgi:hypothetical protein
MNRRQMLMAEQARIDRELRRLDRFPWEDPFVDGDVISFNKVFPNSTTTYNYAAIRTNGHWYTTGPRNPKHYLWDELVEFLGSGGADIYLMNKSGSELFPER